MAAVPNHLFRPAVLAVGLAVVLAAGPAVTAAAHQAAGAQQTARSVFLVTGELIRPGEPGAPGVSIPAGAPGARAVPGGQLQVLRLGGKTYMMPSTAVAYLGRGLDPSLFGISALAGAESGGRLPVRVTYSGPVPALPGVRITSSGSGAAEGYLTVAGARAFGAALARQFAADHADGGYGRDGLFRNGVSITLAGAPAAPRPGRVRPRYVMHTLTVRGTDLSGRPDTGDSVMIVDADNASRFWDPVESRNSFYHGTVRFSVPAGHFWVFGIFSQFRGTRLVGTRLVVLPEITVDKATTARMAERAADSKVAFVTSRRAMLNYVVFDVSFLTDKAVTAPGDCCGLTWTFFDYGTPFPALYVSPMAVPPRTGRLDQVTFAQLASPAAAPGARYAYDLAYQSGGTIPPQHFVVNQDRLATENARFYAAVPSAGYLGTSEAFPQQRSLPLSAPTVLWPARYPQRLTMYLLASPGLSWQTTYVQNAREGMSGGQAGVPQIFLPGQRVSVGWGAYPLHPAPFASLMRVSATPIPVSASRAGDTLRLAMTAFSDSVPGHTGQGTFPPARASGSYQIDQNGTRIAGGALRRFFGFFRTTARLRPARSVIRFALDAAEPGRLDPLSEASRTVWTWRSAHETGSRLPPGWSCLPNGQLARGCAVQPLLTLRYGVLGEGLDGSAGPGQQVVRVSVGHLQLARASKITSAAVSVSFDGGQSWQPAQMTGAGGTYAAVFNAPAGARVTLKTHATDAAGGSVTETITNAYQVAAASTGPGVRAACPEALPRHARCYALYAPQARVNAAIAARADGRPVAPGATAPAGWGARDIESAYKLPVSRGAGQTVAVVDAYSTPHLASDLGVYRKQYGLPPCTSATGCLRIVNQQGKASPLPPADPLGWGVEETLDVSMVSAACPRCKIIVVEARTNSLADLAAAEDAAARLGAQVISNSWGARENGFTQAEARFYRHPGHVTVASSGDDGFTAAAFPANLANVTAVGGTELAKAHNARGWTESVWNNAFGASGSGCSAYVAKPSWQHDRHCPGRTVADVAALASNVPIYDSSITRRLGGPWLTLYGTSAAAPLIAGVYALAGNAATVPPGYAYAHPSALFDVTRGNNDWFNQTRGAVCGYDYLCVAKPGYDAPTGLGTPDGTGAF